METSHTGARKEIIFSFGPFRLVPSRQLLLLDQHPVKLGGRAFDLLKLLVQRGGELVSKDELMAAAWPGTFVHESNLKVNMWSLRRSLGDTQTHPAFIATVAGRGYRFVAGVQASIADLADHISADEAAYLSQPPSARGIVGREGEIEDILEAMAHRPQVSIVGAGGVGKTTVAVAAARAYAPECRDGVCFVDLATIDDPTLFAAALVTALGIRGNPDNSLTAILDYLQPRQMLVILDNCEHVLPAATIFAGRLSGQGGQSKLLATSREPLGTTAEHVIRLGSLAFPGSGDGLTAEKALRYPAVQLFVRRATEWADYQLVDADCNAVASICHSLDGLPLAIELAAAKLETHRPHDVLAMLDKHLGFANRSAKGAPPRHETLMAAIDWSYRLLSPKEAALFRLVSVFSDAFEVEDVIFVAEAAALNAVDVVTGLGSLVAKSLLTAQVRGPELRYRLLDSTRRYAMEKRQGDPFDAPALQRHAQHMLQLFKQSEEDWNWRESKDWTRRYLSRIADLRAALSWAFGDGGDPLLGIELTVAAIPLWSETSILSEAQERVERALAMAETLTCDDLLRAKLACSLGWSRFYARKLPDENESVWLDAIAFAKRSGDLEYQQRTLVGLGFYLLQVGEIDKAILRLEESRDLSERHRDWSAAPEGDRALAWARAHAGELAESRDVLDRLAATYSLADGRSRKDANEVYRFVTIRCYLPFVAWMHGHYDQAAALVREAVAAADRTGHWVSQSNALGLAALPLALETGDVESLERYCAMLRSNLMRENIARWVPTERYFLGWLHELHGDPRGIDEIGDAVAELIECRYLMRIGMYLAGYARALVRHGRLDEAADTIAQALQRQEAQGERWCRSELLRLDASLLARSRQLLRAEQRWTEALNEARAIGALSFELRIASDLAAHFIDDGRGVEAEQLLGPVYQKFTEGFATHDLVVAADLLHRATQISGESDDRLRTSQPLVQRSRRP